MSDPASQPITIVAIIPLYNGARYIESAIRSVLDQTRKPDEFFVVDDGSTDDGPALVAKLAETLPVRLLRKSNGGQSSARNFGVRASACSHIALLDQDDLWYPHHLATLEAAFRSAPEAKLGWVYGNLDRIDAAGAVVGRAMLHQYPATHPKTSVAQCIREDMYVLPSASLIARAAFDAVGGFDERLAGYEDDDLFLRLLQAGYANHFIDTPLLQWRLHAASTSFSPLMARSRMIYVEKLFAAFPDDATGQVYFSRDLIAPRFIYALLGEYRRALMAGDHRGFDKTYEHLRATVIPHARPAYRILFGSFGWLMRSPAVARLAVGLMTRIGSPSGIRRALGVR